MVWWSDLDEARNRALYQRVLMLSRLGRVYLFTTDDAYVPSALADLIEVRRIRVGAMSRGGVVAEIAFYRSLATATLAALRAELHPEQDAVHTFHTFEADVGRRAKRFGYHWIADVLDMPDLYLETVLDGAAAFRTSARRRFLYSAVYRLDKCFREADVVITTAHGPDRGFARRLVEEWGIPDTRLILTTNGVDMDWTADAGPLHPMPPVRAAYVGTVAESRGADTVLLAAAESGVRQLEITFAGPVARAFQPRIASLKAAAERAGVAVRILGPLPPKQMLDVVRDAHVCLYPFPRTQVLDGVHPIKVFEYLAAGRAVLASDLDGVRGVVQDGVNGRLLPPRDVGAWAEAFRRIASDGSALERMAAVARASVGPYDWRGINDRLERELSDRLIRRKVASA